MTTASLIATLLLAVTGDPNLDSDNDPKNACFEAYEALSQVDSTYLTTMQAICDATTRTAAYWKCVKKKVEAGATPAFSTEHCDDSQ